MRLLLFVLLFCACDGAGAPRFERYITSRHGDTRMVLEVDFVAGAEPRTEAGADLVARLEALLDKPDGIEIVLDDEIDSRGADHAWTFGELDALANETFDDGPAGTVTMHVMWIDGHDEGDSPSGATLGLAWDHTHIAMYHDTIESSCDGGPILGERLCIEAQTLIWLHEVGHNLGLVDNGLAMVEPHRDPDHGAHDQNEECVMYFAFDGSTGLDLLRERLTGGGSMHDFDAECLADIAAAR